MSWTRARWILRLSLYSNPGKRNLRHVIPNGMLVLQLMTPTELPALHPTFGKKDCANADRRHGADVFAAIPTEENGGNHTAKFTKAAATEEAHVAAITTAKTLAITGVRILLDEEFTATVSASLRRSLRPSRKLRYFRRSKRTSRREKLLGRYLSVTKRYFDVIYDGTMLRVNEMQVMVSKWDKWSRTEDCMSGGGRNIPKSMRARLRLLRQHVLVLLVFVLVPAVPRDL